MIRPEPDPLTPLGGSSVVLPHNFLVNKKNSPFLNNYLFYRRTSSDSSESFGSGVLSQDQFFFLS
jgi:oligoribonuclease (3'-5' exoribonuclease)